MQRVEAMATTAAAQRRSQIAPNDRRQRIPVPVADSQVNSYSACSAVGSRTTGGVRTIASCRPGTSKLTLTAEVSALTCGNPHTKTKTRNSTHGTHAPATWRVIVSRRDSPPSCAYSHLEFGCQTAGTRRGTPATRARRDVDEPGAVKLDTRNCTTAKLPPQTSERRPDAEHAAPAGHHPDEPHRHDQREERQLPAGHRAEPQLAEPVTFASVEIGVPSAPNATGDVLASSASPAACAGGSRRRAAGPPRWRPACRTRPPPRRTRRSRTRSGAPGSADRRKGRAPSA